MKRAYPSISTEFALDPGKKTHPFYVDAVERIMSHMLPPQFFEGEDVLYRLHAKLPIVCWTPLKTPPFTLSFFLWSPFRPNAFRFFSEMVTRWLIPGKRLNARLQFAVDFYIPAFGEQKYLAGEVMVQIESEKELEILERHLPTIESEIRLGVESYYQACRILEIKGITSDEKTALIQENIVALIKHRPQDFDYDILSGMQHFLVLCKEEFKQLRSWRHMSRIICVHYLFRKSLRFSLEVYPEKRYIHVKLIRSRLPNERPVLGVAVGMSFLRENEQFEARHLLNGIQALLPSVVEVKGSFFCDKSRSDSTVTVYAEIEKEGGKMISLEEERLLKEELPTELKSRIEQRLNPIFMPQNEEVIMRYILTLSRELKYVRDLPQVILDFTQQTEEHLEFLVVALRVVTSALLPISAYFEAKPTILDYQPDRCKIVGKFRKKHKKEATVFRLKIKKAPFLRKDHAVDLNKARLQVVGELTRVMGEFRDYNGGTLSKKTELFERLRSALGKKAREHAFLLENYFYSFHPPIMRSVLPVQPFKELFDMVLEIDGGVIGNQAPYQIQMRQVADALCLLVTARDYGFREVLLGVLKPYAGRVGSCLIQQTENPCLGVIVRGANDEEALKLRLTIEQTMAELYVPSYSL